MKKVKVAIVGSPQKNVMQNKEIEKARTSLANIWKENKVEMVRVSLEDYDKKKKCFSKYYIDTKKWIYKKEEKKYTPDIIRIRNNSGIQYTYNILEKHRIIPGKNVGEIWSDKYLQYLYFKEFQPTTAILKNFFSNTKIQNGMNEKVVIKPINWNWWKGIKVYTKKQLIQQKDIFTWLEKLFIVQDFKDFSKWYQWLVEGVHDLRICYVWNTFCYGAIRVAAKKEFRANLQSGGSSFSIEKKQIPKEVFDIAKVCQKIIWKEKGNVYSLDFSYCAPEKRWYLLEMNYSPGIYVWDAKKYHIDIIKLCRKLGS